MSILGDGASCAAGANPLAQMAKMQNVDRSLQREGMTPQGVTGLGGLRGAEHRQLSQQDRHMLHNMQHGAPRDAFRFDDMKQDLPGGLGGPGGGWAAEFASARPQNAWASEFRQSPQPGPSQAPQAGPSQVASPPPMAATQMPSSQLGFSSGLGMNRFGYGMTPNFAHSMQPHMAGAPAQMNADQAKHAETDSKWEEQFKRLEEQNASDAVKEQQADTTGDAALASTAEPETVTRVEDDGTVLLNDDDEELDASAWLNSAYPPNWDEMWDKISHADDGSARFRSGTDFRTATGEYEFAKENEYSNEEDPFALGVYMMDNGAKLSCAVLCFEEAVRRNPNHVEAWARLGDAQAQNEVEDQAIVALEKTISLDPRHERALLNLAISYTNEGYDAAASQILELWIGSKYPDIASEFPQVSETDRDALHARVTRMFLKAAQRVTDNGQLDPEVQVGLGALCYRDDDYDKAVDCFRAGLSVRPNDASLWNRLGATLANASRPEEAIEAYHRALELRPSFVRARYNIAVLCINLGCYKEAATHLLSAMSLHETEDGLGVNFNRSANLLDTLRRVFFAMDRRDLLAKLKPGMSLNEFRDEFTF